MGNSVTYVGMCVFSNGYKIVGQVSCLSLLDGLEAYAIPLRFIPNRNAYIGKLYESERRHAALHM